MFRPVLFCAVTCALLLVHPNSLRSQALRGSPASVDRIYRQAVNHRLRFYESAAAIREGQRLGQLARLDGNADYTLVDVSYPLAVPAAKTFIVRLASQYRAACGEKLVVTSATRPTTMRLANSVDKSVHPTGMAIDLRKPRNSKCLSWLRNTLVALDATGVLEAVEERNPPHFHVAIFPQPYQQYVAVRPGPKVPETPPVARASTAVLADARRYEVRRGDSLWTIARQNSLTVEELQRVNNLRNSRILAGQVLLIPQAR
jgi:hypothetical protein